MNSREKTLFVTLLVVLFGIANVLAYKKFYEPKVAKAESAATKAKVERGRALLVLEKREEMEPEMTFLRQAEGKPTTYQEAQADLQDLVKKEADRRDLETRSEDILPWLEGTYYSRVRVRYKVNGMEQQVQQWVMVLHQPKQLQVVTKLEIKPQSNDPTRVDCEVEIEKWFVPEKNKGDEG